MEPLNLTALTEAMTLLDQVEAMRGSKMLPRQRAALVMGLYMDQMAQTPITVEYLKKLADSGPSA